MARSRNSIAIFIALSAVLIAGCGQDMTGAEQQGKTTITLSDSVGSSEITVYKSPSCGCCKEWVSYLEEEGYSVSTIDHDNVDEVKTRLGLTKPELKSCHTAIVDGYIIEGHVPANDIRKLLAEKPANILGLTAPGMPMKSPGMGSRIPEDYAVLSFTDTGDTAVYSQY